MTAPHLTRMRTIHPTGSFPTVAVDPRLRAGASLSYSFHDTPFGRALIASSPDGVCFIGFPNSEHEGLDALKRRFAHASLKHGQDARQKRALRLLLEKTPVQKALPLHLIGTPFQAAVWNALLRVPRGALTTYGALARAIKRPTAVRAVGTAVGRNPIAVLIPCHRVLPANGSLGSYHWGPRLKAALLAREGITFAKTKKPGRVPGGAHLEPSAAGGGSSKGKR